jgi:hypothetical protein
VVSAVELHVGVQVLEEGVAVLRTAPAADRCLAACRQREAVRAQDPVEEAVLEHGVGARGQVVDQRTQQPPS